MSNNTSISLAEATSEQPHTKPLYELETVEVTQPTPTDTPLSEWQTQVQPMINGKKDKNGTPTEIYGALYKPPLTVLIDTNDGMKTAYEIIKSMDGAKYQNNCKCPVNNPDHSSPENSAVYHYDTRGNFAITCKHDSCRVKLDE